MKTNLARKTETKPFGLFVQLAGDATLRLEVRYPAGTSPREIAAHQFAQHPDYLWITVTRQFESAMYSFPRYDFETR